LKGLARFGLGNDNDAVLIADDDVAGIADTAGDGLTTARRL
jgi:hypothetical protein